MHVSAWIFICLFQHVRTCVCVCVCVRERVPEQNALLTVIDCLFEDKAPCIPPAVLQCGPLIVEDTSLSLSPL